MTSTGLENVPAAEQYFTTDQNACLIRPWYSASDSESDGDESRIGATVAVKQFPMKLLEQAKTLERLYGDLAQRIGSFLQIGHGGKLAYFGDAHGEVKDNFS